MCAIPAATLIIGGILAGIILTMVVQLIVHVNMGD